MQGVNPYGPEVTEQNQIMYSGATAKALGSKTEWRFPYPIYATFPLFWVVSYICPYHAPRAASDVLRIHSETFCLFAFAALLNRSCSAFANRTGTILPFASPLGSLGLPTFLGFCWFATFELLSNRCSHCHRCGQDRRDM